MLVSIHFIFLSINSDSNSPLITSTSTVDSLHCLLFGSTKKYIAGKGSRKKVIFFSGQSTKDLSPPLGLVVKRTATNKKKTNKKKLFFFSGQPLRMHRMVP